MVAIFSIAPYRFTPHSGGDTALWMCMQHGVERERRVRIGSARAHLGRHPDGFHDLGLRGTRFERRLRVPANAVRALRHMRHRHRNQLLGLARLCTVGKYGSAKSLEGVERLRRQFAALARNVSAGVGIEGFVHRKLLSKPKSIRPRGPWVAGSCRPRSETGSPGGSSR